MVDHFSDLTYFRLMRITIQEETLSGKSAFVRWAATFGVKIHRYHAENEIFSEQTFISEIYYSKHIIKFVGLGHITKVPSLKEKFMLSH